MPRKELVHLTHAFIRIVLGRPEKVKLVIQKLLNVNFSTFMPASRLGLARVKSRQQKCVRKAACNPADSKHVAIANVNWNGAGAVVAVPKLPKVIAPPRPHAAVGLHCSHMLPAAAKSNDADPIHGNCICRLRTLHSVAQTQLPVPAGSVSGEQMREIEDFACCRPTKIFARCRSRRR